VSVKAGPYADGTDGVVWVIDVGLAPKPGDYPYVGMHGIGPKGGWWFGPTFYNRECVTQLIGELIEARDRVFPDEPTP
jgi:hypothetical protein